MSSTSPTPAIVTLQESEMLFRTMADSAPVLIWMSGPDALCTFFNKSWLEFTGRTIGQEQGNGWTEGVHPDDLQYCVDTYLSAFHAHQEFRMEYRLQRADGEYRWLFDTGVPRFNPDGGFAGYIGSCIDITERKNTEQALQEGETKTQAILNTAVDGVITIDEQGVIESFNPAAERLFGYATQEVVGQRINRLMPPPYREEHDTYLMNYLRTNKAKIIGIGREVIGQRKDGTTFPMELAVSDVHLRDRRLFTGIVRDITERKKAEEELIASLREKEALLKEIHHRVKNNLQVVYSLLDLQSGYTDDPLVIDMFRESQRRVKSMALIHQKLYQSRDFTKIDFHEYIKNLAEDLFSSYGVYPDLIDLRIEVEHVPLDLHTAIPCGLIINELISNALKHAFPDGSNGEICITLRQDQERQSTLIFRDNGIGFPQHLDFRRTTSLGLQLVNLLTEQLGGAIQLYNSDGACFVIQFPPSAGV